jgi:geranylgeranyl pyrophosphate synthase
MRYALLSGGKRMRPAVLLAACEAAGGERSQARAGACALEMIHAYSLVHDDLPAMDDDSERRGKPTVHVRFGEANAILIGDALLTHAFAVLAGAAELDAAQRVASVATLARHAGVFGMVGGQARDLALGQAIDEIELLERVHAEKTGALYAAAGALGAIAAGSTPEVIADLEAYGLDFGVAFQHADDVLDDEQTPLRSAAAQRLAQLRESCSARAEGYGDAGRALSALGDWVLARGKPV